LKESPGLCYSYPLNRNKKIRKQKRNYYKGGLYETRTPQPDQGVRVALMDRFARGVQEVQVAPADLEDPSFLVLQDHPDAQVASVDRFVRVVQGEQAARVDTEAKGTQAYNILHNLIPAICISINSSWIKWLKNDK
jgi:hypothetical protein